MSGTRDVRIQRGCVSFKEKLEMLQRKCQPALSRRQFPQAIIDFALSVPTAMIMMEFISLWPTPYLRPVEFVLPLLVMKANEIVEFFLENENPLNLLRRIGHRVFMAHAGKFVIGFMLCAGAGLYLGLEEILEKIIFGHEIKHSLHIFRIEHSPFLHAAISMTASGILYALPNIILSVCVPALPSIREPGQQLNYLQQGYKRFVHHPLTVLALTSVPYQIAYVCGRADIALNPFFIMLAIPLGSLRRMAKYMADTNDPLVNLVPRSLMLGEEFVPSKLEIAFAVLRNLLREGIIGLPGCLSFLFTYYFLHALNPTLSASVNFRMQSEFMAAFIGLITVELAAIAYDNAAIIKQKVTNCWATLHFSAKQPAGVAKNLELLDVQDIPEVSTATLVATV